MRLFLSISVAAALFCALYVLTSPGTLVDDAYISFRYAEHLVEGQGLVFNPGGERVEGYSNFLWVMLLAGLSSVGISPPAGARALQFLAALATLPLTAVIYSRISSTDRTSRLPSFLPGLVLSLNLSFLVHAHLGLESALFALAALLVVERFIAELDNPGFPFSALACVLASLLRPEGALFAGLLAVQALLLWRDKGKVLPYVVRWLLVFVCPLLVYHAWRYWYFGAPLPNTFYAKVSAPIMQRVIQGFTYLYCTLTGYDSGEWRPYGLAPLRWVAFVPIIGVVFSGLEPRRLLLLSATLGYLAFIVYAGGDWMPYNRFVAHIAPVLAILTILGIDDGRAWLEKRLGRKRSAASGLAFLSVLAVTLASLHVPHSPYNVSILKSLECAARQPGFIAAQANRVTGGSVTWGQEIGAWMTGNLPVYSRISVELAGQIPYFTDFSFLDTYGLNDRRIAQIIRSRPENVPDYILSQKPYAFTLQLRFKDGQLYFQSYYERVAFEREVFARAYTLAAIHRVAMKIPAWDEMWIATFTRKNAPDPSPSANAPLTVATLGDILNVGLTAPAGTVFHVDTPYIQYGS